jgi:hypothetical protein
VTSAVWGAGMLSEAALRAVLIFLLPIDVMVVLSTAMWGTTVVLLVLWTRWYANCGDEKERQPETGGPAQAQEA